MGESDGAFLVMRSLTVPHTNSRHLRTNYNTLLIFIIGEYFVLVLVFCFSFRGGDGGCGGGNGGAPAHCWSAKAELVGGTRNVREALSIKKLSLCLFFCSILCSTACVSI